MKVIRSVLYALFIGAIIQGSSLLAQSNPPPGMALVPAGSFVMGDGLDGESDAPTGTVYVSGFYMDTNLVGYGLWQQIFRWAATNGYSFANAGFGFAANYPVRSIYWYDAVKWCNARSQMAGLTPVYYTDSNLTQIYKTGNVDAVYANWTVSAYRLPTEAEWEKAARGGLSGQRFPWGSLISETNANYDGDPFNASANTGYEYDLGPAGNDQIFNDGGGIFLATFTSPVGYFATNGNTLTNGYGLNDMTGNVFEWCWDWYGPYGSGPQTDPHGASTGTARVARGGSWLHFANECRTAFRGSDAPNFGDDELGFRTALPQPPSAIVTLSANPVDGGAVGGGGTFAIGSTNTVTATANNGFIFTGWATNGVVVSTASNYSFTLGSNNEALVANFEQTYTISVFSSPNNEGTVDGDGTFVSGSTNSVTAMPDTGYQFVNWTDENGDILSTLAGYTFTLTNDQVLFANFSAIPVNSISLIASPSGGGMVTGGGTFASGNTYVVTAAANPGYQFVNWTDTNGSVESVSTNYSFVLNSNQILFANFTLNSVDYSISVIASPSAGGTVAGGGTFPVGSINAVIATANTGYHFVSWTEGGSTASASTNYSFPLTGNQILVANFAPDPLNFISVIASPGNGGTVSGSGVFASGSTNTVTAKANPAYHFVNWTEINGNVASTAALYTFTLTSDQILFANYGLNLVKPIKGTYNGLFFNTTNGVTEQTAGMLKNLAVSQKGTYSGTILLDSGSYGISGAFDIYGQATNTIARSSGRGGPLTVVMTLVNSSNSPSQVVGTVTGTNWADTNLLAEFATNAVPSAEYTLLLPPDTNNAPPTNSPGGDGYALLTNKAGTATITGALADGTAFSQTAPVSQEGDIPVYASLYTGKGLLLGWINLEPTNAAGVSLTWIHPQRATGLYQKGFTNVLAANQVLLSPWTNPPENIALMTNLSVLDVIGDTNISIEVSTATPGKITGAAVNGTINSKTGLLTVTIGTGANKITGHGAILLNATNGGGYYLTTSKAQAITLGP